MFNGDSSPAIYTGPVANQGGFNLSISGADGITNATVSPNPSRRNTPIQQFNDTLSWTRGTHTFNVGGSLSNITNFSSNSTMAPTITFGVDTTDPASSLFTTANFPGAASADTSKAQGIYAVLVGSITQIGANALLDEQTNKYVYLGNNTQRCQMREWGFFAQDSWRTTSHLTLSYGLRWEIQNPVTSQNDSLSTATLADIYGISGPGNIFKPGTLAGRDTQFIQFRQGDQPYGTLWRNFAPSMGVAWSPKSDAKIVKWIFGSSGQSVFRAGYSMSFNRDGITTLFGTVSGNPGPSITASRNMTLGNLVTNVGSDKLPVLLSQRDRLNAPSFVSAPTYPFTGALTNGVSVYDPNYRMPYVMSWNVGFQRELTRDMVVEVRYVATRGLAMRSSTNVNEVNIIENGFLNEFKLAMANLQANIAGGKGNTFAYTGVTGTSPLPAILGYFSGLTGADVNNPAKYTSSLFTNSTFVNPLAAANPAPYTFANNLYNNSTRAANALTAGLARNFFLTNPGLQGGASYVGNGGHSYYDAGVVELRRRLSHGLLVQSSYTLARGYQLNSPSLRAQWYKTPNSLVLTHAFKTDWIWDFPVGHGRRFLNTSGFVNTLLGNWSYQGTARLQTGAPFSVSISNTTSVKLVGITRRELQQAVKMRFDAPGGIAYYLPQDLVDNTILAFNTSATSSTGYSTRGVPQGRYLAPAGSANCVEVSAGQCGFPNLVLYGPGFVRFDMSLIKKIRFNERAGFEFRAEFLNAFNNINFMVGSPNNASTGIGVGGDTFGRVTNAYRDISTTNDPGGRLIQFVVRINF